MESTVNKKRQKGRSPRYPGIPLDQALDRAKQLWEKEAQYPTNVQTVMGHWGYAARSGGGAVAIAALKAYGLITDDGSGDARTVQITKDCQWIMISDDKAVVRQLVQKAALLPPAHKDLWERYGPTLPSEPSLLLYLTSERQFTQDGAKWFIQVYKRTINFAGLTEKGATVTPQPEEDPPAQEQPEIMPPPTTVKPPTGSAQGSAPAPAVTLASTRTIQVPYSPSEWALLQAPFPMTEAEWKAMLAVLDAMKPGLVRPSDD